MDWPMLGDQFMYKALTLLRLEIWVASTLQLTTNHAVATIRGVLELVSCCLAAPWQFN